MANEEIKRICLWSGPRNISTTLMYSFAQRSDTKVFDEPLYAHYLSHSNARVYHPGAADIISSMDNDGDNVIRMMMGNHSKPVVFFKNMTHHLLGLDKSFMSEVYNVILTRDPAEMLPSFVKVIDNPTMEDVGYAQHTELVAYLRNQQIEPIVLDSKRILLNPEQILKALCQKLNIPFDYSMLTWKKGARPEDGIWAKYWYGNIHNSTGFLNYQKKATAIPEKLRPLLEECIPHYEKLLSMAL